MNIALLGPSGVGKGTHGIQLARQLDLVICATGDLLRENLSEQTAVGFLAQPYVDASEPVPDNIVNAMVAEWIVRMDRAKDCASDITGNSKKGILFTGYPRTQAQASSLDDLLSRSGRNLDKVFNLEISDQLVEQRLTGRIICQDCKQPFHRTLNRPKQQGVCDHCSGKLQPRAEDIPELIKVRLRTHRRSLGPLLQYYEQSGRLMNIDAERTIAKIRELLAVAADSAQAKSRIVTGQSKAADAVLYSGAMISALNVQHQSFDVILLGGPGSGKGTQAEKLRTYLDLSHIATGDLFRENLKNNTSLGQLAKTYMDRGALVPDDVTEAMVEERLARSDTSPGFILDGFPRTISQAHALTDIMNSMKRRVSCVLYIRVSDEEIIKRLSGRLICRDCQTPFHVDFKPPRESGKCDLCNGELYQRDDDNPKTVAARLQTFHEQTGPIINYYQAARVLREIDGEGRPEDVVERSVTVVDSVRNALN